MAELKEYKCPCCGGAIAFDSATQKLKCPYCDTEFEIETLEGFEQDVQSVKTDDMEWKTDETAEWKDTDEDGIKVFVCHSCGGEIIGDANTAATACPFCGNPVVMTGNLSGALKPDLVIPFKLDKNAAKEGLRKHLQGKKLLPAIFSDENHIDEVKGVYVPFWLFDANADANLRYKATRTRTWSDSRYIYHETSYYSVTRAGTLDFKAVPVDGSKKMADDLMQSLEPFDLREAVDFKTAYLAGYFADKYDVSADESVGCANDRVKTSTEQTFAQTVNGFATVTPEASSIKLDNGKAKYALFPVWLLNTTWNGNQYTFAMNGQTGKFVGDLPMDKAKKNKILLGVTAAVGAAIFLAEYLVWLF